MKQKLKLWIILVIFALLALPSLELSSNAAAFSVIYVPDDYLTIQDAVNAAIPGDTIIVRDGTYIENVNIKKRLTIMSENGPEKTIVQAKDSYFTVFKVTAYYVDISGFTIKNGSWTEGIGLYGVSHCDISNNNILNNNVGIHLSDSSINSISENNITANEDDGIHLSDSSKNSISRNSITANEDDGIYLYGFSINSISRNSITANEGNGIYLSSSSKNSISRNNITANGGNGIYLHYSSKNNISRNNITENENGILLEDGSSVNNITVNNIEYNGGGIYLSASSENNISRNSIIANKDGIFLDSSHGNSIYLNNFIENTHNVASYSSDNTWNSIEKLNYTYKRKIYKNYLGNYWDDYAGSDTDQNGIGDTPYSINSDKDNFPLIQTKENYRIIPLASVPSPTPTPGFEVFLAMGGLLVVGYLMKRRR